jgi:uncharacterized protein YecT (DUF1311 family)
MLRFLPGLIFIGLVAFALPANALDCSSRDARKDKVVTAICNDPQLRQADKDMNAAYQSLYRGRDKKQRIALKTLQKDWLGNMRGCDATDAPCLLASTRSRTDFLRGAEGIGPTSQGKLIFKGYYVPGLPWEGWRDLTVFEFADPDTAAKKAFNDAVEKLFTGAGGDNTGGHDKPDTSYKPGPGDYDCSKCVVEISMGQPFQGRNFMSAPVRHMWDTVGIEYGSNTFVNVFLDRTDAFDFGDLFNEADASELAQLCYDQITAAMDAESDNDELQDASAGGNPASKRPSDTFMHAFRNTDNWGFDGKTVTVNVPLGNLGKYVDSAESCTLSYDVLKPHLAGKATLPVAIDQSPQAMKTARLVKIK